MSYCTQVNFMQFQNELEYCSVLIILPPISLPARRYKLVCTPLAPLLRRPCADARCNERIEAASRIRVLWRTHNSPSDPAPCASVQACTPLTLPLVRRLEMHGWMHGWMHGYWVK